MLQGKRILVGLAVLLGIACGDDATDDTGTAQHASAAVTVESLGGTAVVEGTVRFEGSVPQSPEIRISGDPYCVDIHGSSFVDPDVVLDDDGHVQNVFVYLSGVPDHRYAVPDEAATIDQSGCMYVPRVLGVQVGQKVEFRNSDPTLHNVHSVVDEELGNEPFNFGMPGRKGVVIERVFRAREVMARIKCDVHPWMVAWMGVLPHPWYAVTDSTGRFRIDRVPDGEYVVEAWHERFGRARASVVVTAGVAEALEIVFKAAAEAPQD